MEPTQIVALSLFAPGFMLCAATFHVVRSRRAFLDGAERGPGTVLSHTERVSTNSDGQRSRTWAPVVSFAGPDGAIHSFTTTSSTSHPPAVGSVVDVAWRAGDPSTARLAAPPLAWLVPVMLLGTGVPLIVAGLIVLLI